MYVLFITRLPFLHTLMLAPQLREFDNARKIYEEYIEYDSSNPVPWIQYAGLESLLPDINRARAIYDLTITQQPLTTPEILWKSYIDFEVGEGEREKARELYERLVKLSGHWKVWVAFGIFGGMEIRVGGGDDDNEEEEKEEETVLPGDLASARAVFQRGYDDLKVKGAVRHDESVEQWLGRV
jgi:crooked neck